MSNLKKLYAYLLSYLPSQFPLGAQAFDGYLASIRGLVKADLSQVPDDDIRFVLATTITHQGPTVDRMPKQKMVRILQAAAAKQVAAQVFQQVKERQKTAQEEAAKNAKAQEETAKG